MRSVTHDIIILQENFQHKTSDLVYINYSHFQKVNRFDITRARKQSSEIRQKIPQSCGANVGKAPLTFRN